MCGVCFHCTCTPVCKFVCVANYSEVDGLHNVHTLLAQGGHCSITVDGVCIVSSKYIAVYIASWMVE